MPATPRFRLHGAHRLLQALLLCTLLPPMAQAQSCQPEPFPGTTLFVRGVENDWSAEEEHALVWQCTAYFVNIQAHGDFDFKIGDASWQDATTFAAAHPLSTPLSNQQLTTLATASRGGIHPLRAHFDGAHTLVLRIVDGLATLELKPLSFVAPGTAPIANPLLLRIRHDSRAIFDKAPFGAVPQGQSLHWRLHGPKTLRHVQLVIEKRRLEGDQTVLAYENPTVLTMHRGADGSWQATHSFAHIGVYGYFFRFDYGGRQYIYQNNADKLYWSRERGSNGLGVLTPLPERSESIHRFRQTVYRPDFQVPEWGKQAIYYYIFPERFRNGDPSNDPQPGRDLYQDQPVERHAHWLERPYKPGSGDGSDAVGSNDFFGGDLAGVIEKLDTLHELGITALYMTPLFVASSNHKYDTADYRHIDPHFGRDEDYTRLTEEAARRGIRVVMDASFNHTGRDSIYFDRFGKYPGIGAMKGGIIRPDSPYAHWYSFNTQASDPDRSYTGWTGVIDLPETNKHDPSFRSFVFGAQGVSQLWLDRGASGWRMDVAPWVPDDFWRDWRTAVKKHRTDALTIAETWFDASKYFLGDMFDSTMNYIFRNAVLDIAKGRPFDQTYRAIEYMREVYPAQAFAALMNLISSHDVARALYVLGYHDAHDDITQIELAKQRFRLATFMQMTLPGAPAIYYGDEVGITGGDDPDNRATYPWPDQGGTPDLALRATVRTLIALRRAHPALCTGSLSAPLMQDAHVLAVQRTAESETALVFFNNDTRERTVRLPVGMARNWQDALTGQSVPLQQDGTLTLKVPPLFGSVLISPHPLPPIVRAARRENAANRPGRAEKAPR